MTRKADIQRLLPVAQLILDQRLAELRDLTAQKNRSLFQLGAMDRSLTAPGLDGVAGELVALRYQSWASQRRKELNLLLSRQTAAWIEARDEASLAFGKVQTLQALHQRTDRGG